ncbi:MAG: hypothetical protein RPR97_18960 [Colwellia sp.]
MFACTFSVATYVALLILATIWLQEGIWKTFQQRTANAIITIEDKLALNENEPSNELVKPYLVHKQWQGNRSTTKALIAEYVSNSLKPTVLYPYVPLMLVVLIF